MDTSLGLSLQSWRPKLNLSFSHHVKNMYWCTSQNMINLTLSGISWKIKKSEDLIKSLVRMLNHSNGAMTESSSQRHLSRRSMSQKVKKLKSQKRSLFLIKSVSTSFHLASCPQTMMETELLFLQRVSQTSYGCQTKIGSFFHLSQTLKMFNLE